MAVTIAQICDAIKGVIGGLTEVTRSQSYNELTEGVNAGDTPLVQVYWQAMAMAPPGRTDRTTFGAGIRNKELTFHVDVYAQQRAHIGEDMASLVTVFDAILTALEAQDQKPYFGLDGLKAFSVTAQRVTFDYGGAQYVGCRAILTVWVY